MSNRKILFCAHTHIPHVHTGLKVKYTPLSTSRTHFRCMRAHETQRARTRGVRTHTRASAHARGTVPRAHARAKIPNWKSGIGYVYCRSRSLEGMEEYRATQQPVRLSNGALYDIDLIEFRKQISKCCERRWIAIPAATT
jgi:hypothetical protein